MLGVYIAGGSTERERIHTVIDALDACAHPIMVTFDWTRDSGYDYGPCGKPSEHAHLLDYHGVHACDVFWLCTPKVISEGASVELGLAIAWQKKIIISNPREVNPFHRFAHHLFQSHDQAMNWLIEEAKARHGR